MRWPDGVYCPRCGTGDKVSKLAKPFKWQCKACAKNGYKFSPLAATIFENTNYPLQRNIGMGFVPYRLVQVLPHPRRDEGPVLPAVTTTGRMMTCSLPYWRDRDRLRCQETAGRFSQEEEKIRPREPASAGL